MCVHACMHVHTNLKTNFWSIKLGDAVPFLKKFSSSIKTYKLHYSYTHYLEGIIARRKKKG